MARARVRGRPAAVNHQSPRRQERRHEIAGVCVVAAGVWLLLSAFGAGGRLGLYVDRFLRSLVGQGIWLIPALVVWVGVALAVHRGWPRGHHRLWGALLALWLMATLAQLTRYPVPYGQIGAPGTMADPDNARLGLGGGWVGYLTIQLLSEVFGVQGRYVVLAAVAVVSALLLTDVSVAAVVAWCGRQSSRLHIGWQLLRAQVRAVWIARQAGAGRSEAAFGGSTTGAVVPQPAGREADSHRAPPGAPRGDAAAAPAISPAAQGPGRGDAAERPPIVIHRPPETVRPSGAVRGEQQPEPGQPEAHPGGSEPGEWKPVRGRRSAPELSSHKAATATGDGQAARSGSGAKPTGHADVAAGYAEYRLPPPELLRRSYGGKAEGEDDIMARARLLEETLETFGVRAKVVEVHPGPTITRFELTPEPGVKVARITSLADDLALNLAATDIRIEAPIPGKRAIGIEVPNREVVTVGLRDVMDAAEFAENPSKLAIAFGKDIAGTPLIGLLERMPHLLVAGTTGSGKSVCLKTIICSILMRARPDEVKLVMVDPKRVELSVYEGIPHLAAPVVTDPRKAAGFLKWAVKEMENRYDLFAAAGVRDIARYNQWVKEPPDEDDVDPEQSPRLPLPHVVIIIDELADLMMVAPVEVEDAICRLAQMARACGMHLVVATQRPSVDVITGLIKANIPSRIAFSVSSQVDSRTILDSAGAEKLLGRGDMLYHPVGYGKPVRAQCAFVSEREVEALVEFIRRQGQRPVFAAEALEVEGTTARGRPAASEADKESAAEVIFAQAVRVVIEHGQASVSILQRRLRCNYTKAARLIDMMEERGFIGPHQGSRPRDVLISLPQWEAIFGGGNGDVAAALASDEDEEF